MRPDVGPLAPHAVAVQATSTKLYSVYGCRPAVREGGRRRKRVHEKNNNNNHILSTQRQQNHRNNLKSSLCFKLDKEKLKDKETPWRQRVKPSSLSLSIHLTAPLLSPRPAVSQRMDPYLSVLNYACHNSIMKQRKDGQPRN